MIQNQRRLPQHVTYVVPISVTTGAKIESAINHRNTSMGGGGCDGGGCAMVRVVAPLR